MAQPAVEVRDLHKSFRIPSVKRETVREHLLQLAWPRSFERLRVLDGISFDVQLGETLGIMGRNGSGKSTLLKILCGIYQADSGTVVARGGITPVLELGVGWNPELDAVDNILLVGTFMGMTLAEAQRSVDGILAFAGLERFASQYLKYYSTGMAARLAYSVAFKAVREILVLDEVFAVGDAEFKERCKRRYGELRAEGRTLVLVSHDPTTVATFCDRALLLENGSLRHVGSGAETAQAYTALMEGCTAPV
jgi:ABC-type polysaccharide/polyol phosphate transport system ATPase subunit